MSSYHLHFYRPIRIWESVLCWLFGQRFKHVCIEFTNGSEWLLDCPKNGSTVVFKSGEFLREFKPNLTMTCSGVDYGSPLWVEAVALFRVSTLDWIGTLRYAVLRHGDIPTNCASLVSRFLDIPLAGTPDEIEERIWQRRNHGRP